MPELFRVPAPGAARPARRRARVVAGAAVATLLVSLTQLPATAGAGTDAVGAAGSAPVAAGVVLPAGATNADPVPTKAWVAALWSTTIAPSLEVPVGWTGSGYPKCAVGTESAQSTAATLRVINAMRAMVQLDPVRFDQDANVRARRAALIMRESGALSHKPARTAENCWSKAGQQAAGQSNLALGVGGARSIELYMEDPGMYNTAVGHRRWILNPRTTVMASGSTSGANALTVFGLGESDSRARPQFMEWPARGWFPAQLEPAGRWSLSASNRFVKFEKATVSVRLLDGKNHAVRTLKARVVSRADYGYGPNTLVFQVPSVAIPKGTSVKAYRVTVRGITGTSNSTYSYTVRLFNP